MAAVRRGKVDVVVCYKLDRLGRSLGHLAAMLACGAGQSLAAADQLLILMQAGSYLTATRGLGASEARICYERSEPLCRLLNRPLLLSVALTGQWHYSLHTDKLTATMHIAERIQALAREQDDAALMIEAHRALAVTVYYSGDFEIAQQYATRALQIWRSGKLSLIRKPPIRQRLSVCAI
jgi:Resolvase, N terminal domain